MRIDNWQKKKKKNEEIIVHRSVVKLINLFGFK